MKRVDRAKYEKLRDRFEKQEFLAMMIPSILPPPTPWKLFVFGAGVFEMRTANFMLAVFCGRLIRDSVTALLTIEYGPRIITLATDLLTRHRRAILFVFLALVGLLAAWIVRKRGRRDESAGPKKIGLEWMEDPSGVPHISTYGAPACCYSSHERAAQISPANCHFSRPDRPPGLR